MLVCAGLPAASVAIDARAAGAATLPPGCTAVKTTVTCTFNYNGTNGSDGSTQTFTVPTGVHVVTIDAMGAQGFALAGAPGGKGGEDGGAVAVTPGEVLSVNAGGANLINSGFNGGGMSGGGGASDVRRAPGGIADRIVVAGGGGGAGDYDSGHGFIGIEGGAGDSGAVSPDPICTSSNICGGGASTTVVGAAGTNAACDEFEGSPDAGGTNGTGGSPGECIFGGEDVLGSGGGGGYYGGGGGGAGGLNGVATGAPGGGGSGWFAPGVVNVVHNPGQHSGNGVVTISYSTRPVPPIGVIVCAISGTASFNKPLTNTPSAMAVSMKLTLTGNSCDHSDVIGGKAPITDVAVKGTFSLTPGATCTSAPSSKDKPQKLQLKWQGRNPKNNLMTVGVTNTTAATLYSIFLPLLPMNAPVLTDPKKPFVEDHIGSNLVVTDPLSDLQAACASSGLATLHFVGAIAAAS
jgi:hypothetical protein